MIERDVDQRLATVHLRTGLLSLARAELETLAGMDQLDDAALLDLAEARWRTGDLPGAGDAARAFLETGAETPLALVVAAEAAAALGRPTEARRLVHRALAHAPGDLEDVFSGMPRSPIWGDGALSADPNAPSGPPSGAVVGERSAEASTSPVASPSAPPSLASATPAALELESARAALLAGDETAATEHLALALRLDPSSAGAVLGMAAGRLGPRFDIVRGDALREAGDLDAARAAWLAAARAWQGTGPDGGFAVGPEPDDAIT